MKRSEWSISTVFVLENISLCQHRLKYEPITIGIAVESKLKKWTELN